MSYDPLVDFLALLRLAPGGMRSERMPGLDYVVAAMYRAGLFRLYVGQTAPTTNQTSTVWLKPSVPSWVAEGTVFLWDASAGQYAVATPALWAIVLSQGGQVFQSVITAADSMSLDTTLLAIQRAAPAATVLTLPPISASALPRKIIDFSTAVTDHHISLVPTGGTVMQQAVWNMYSTADYLAGVTLYPSVNLNSWIIAP